MRYNKKKQLCLMSPAMKIDWSDFGTADSMLTLLCAFRCGNTGTISQGMYILCRYVFI